MTRADATMMTSVRGGRSIGSDRHRIPLQRVLRVRLEVTAEQVQIRVAHRQGDSDRHDHHRGEAGRSMPQRPPQALFEGRAEQTRGDDRGQRGEDHVDPMIRVQDERDERAERDHLAVGEVGQTGGAEDQRQSDRGDGDDHRQLQAVGQRLRQQAQLALHVARVLAEEEGASDVLVPADHRGLLFLALLDRQTLGQRFGVDAHDVGARLLDRDQVHAVGIGDRFADLGAALVLRHDAHVGHRLGRPARRPVRNDSARGR